MFAPMGVSSVICSCDADMAKSWPQNAGIDKNYCDVSMRFPARILNDSLEVDMRRSDTTTKINIETGGTTQATGRLALSQTRIVKSPDADTSRVPSGAKARAWT